MKICGKGIKYLPGKSPYEYKKVFQSKATSCKERYFYLNEKVRNNEYYHSGGPSVFWYLESVRATRKLIRRENVSKIRIPVLLFQGEFDTHVIPRAHNKFANYINSCELIHLKGAKHEGYFENDEITFAFLDRDFR